MKESHRGRFTLDFWAHFTFSPHIVINKKWCPNAHHPLQPPHASRITTIVVSVRKSLFDLSSLKRPRCDYEILIETRIKYRGLNPIYLLHFSCCAGRRSRERVRVPECHRSACCKSMNKLISEFCANCFCLLLQFSVQFWYAHTFKHNQRGFCFLFCTSSTHTPRAEHHSSTVEICRRLRPYRRHTCWKATWGSSRALTSSSPVRLIAEPHFSAALRLCCRLPGCLTCVAAACSRGAAPLPHACPSN